MKRVYFSEIATIGAGQGAPQDPSAFIGNGYPFIRAGSLESLCAGESLDTLEKINNESAKEHRMKLYPAGTVVFAKSGMSATKNRVFVLPNSAYVVSHLSTIDLDREVADPIFVRYFWENYKPSRLIKDDSYPSISAEDIENVEIPLPLLTEQKRIASLLARADRLRQLRRIAHDLSDSVLQSLFLEMFEKYLKPNSLTTPMEKLVTITGGGTPSRDVPEYFQGNIPWLTSKDMRGEYIYDTQEHVTEKAIRESAAKLVPVGSILLVVKSKILMHRLPIAITKVPLCHGQDIKSIQCSNKINPHFLVAVLKYNEANILFQARGANTEGLTLPMLHEIKVPNVPLNLQEEFAGVVSRVESLRGRMGESTRQVEGLFESLLAEAFS